MSSFLFVKLTFCFVILSLLSPPSQSWIINHSGPFRHLKQLRRPAMKEGAPSVNERMIGGTGTAISPNAWPSMVSVYLWDKKEDYWYYRCGGVIWNEMTVLTTAECVTSSNGLVYRKNRLHLNFGQYDKDYFTDESHVYISEVTRHPEFNQSGHLAHNLAVLRLIKPIDSPTAQRDVRCACQPQPLEDVNATECYALGWGYTGPYYNELMEPDPNYDRNSHNASLFPKWLQQMRMYIQSQGTCYQRSIYSSPQGRGSFKAYYDNATTFCASAGKTLGRVTGGPCTGDFGGPFVCAVKAHPMVYSLVGILSKNVYIPMARCGDSYAVTAIVNLLAYVNTSWFQKATQEGEWEPLPVESGNNGNMGTLTGTLLAGAVLLLFLLLGSAAFIGFTGANILEKKGKSPENDGVSQTLPKMASPASTPKQEVPEPK